MKTKVREQRETLIALNKLGFKFVALDLDGDIYAFTEKPYVRKGVWQQETSGGTSKINCVKILLSFFPSEYSYDTSLLDIEKILSDYGVNN